ncbi:MULTISPECIES: hypothetical protein [Halocynthiibacter]|uniref:Uncharacterized protein n=1 Tax=Halocynthiibacter halioticoli TaxID=2986804 RepID=A0AAE3J032_9RHOB|nr:MULTISPECIES: hypothetical protein [Halocynthiibacter]MCV6824076.1 hypothetical protein [Halocynthiibacter halioticoli]MCW4057077.1 hypothetical protein [Halocynthiibacter sp. SDUM655004]
MSISERPLTRQDRDTLKPYSTANEKRSTYLNFAGLFFILFFTIFVALGLLCDFTAWMFAWPDFEVVKWWLCGASAVLSLAYSGNWALQEHKYIKARTGISALADQDLQNGFAAIERLEVAAVVEVEEEEDEGAGFLLELRDGRVLFLVGQDLDFHSLHVEPDAENEVAGDIFPSDKVDFVYAPKSGVRLDVIGTGSYLKPRSWVKRRVGRTRSSSHADPMPDSFNDGPLEDVLKRYGFVEVPASARRENV